MSVANLITFLRIVLVPVFIYLLWKNQHSYLPVIVCCVCAFTDAIDGFVARYFNIKTTVGTFLDPIADKILILSSFYVLTLLEKTPMWLFTIVLGKEVIIISGWLLIYILSKSYIISVTLLGKITVILQISTVIIVLLNLSVKSLFFYLTAFFTLISTIEYCIQGAKQISR